MSRFIPVPKEVDQWVKKVDMSHLAQKIVETKLAELQKGRKDGWTIYTGLGGQAYLYWLLSENAESYEKRKTFLKKGAELIQECLADKRLKDSRCCTFLCGAVGVFALAAVILGKAQYAEEVLNWKQAAFDTESDELLYGKSGYLAALLFVRDHADFGGDLRLRASNPKRGRLDNSDLTRDYVSADTESLDEQDRLARLGHKLSDAFRKAIKEVGVRILLDGERVENPDSRYWKKPDHLYWTWHRKQYLGIHGTAAILSLLISAGFRSRQIWQTVDWLHAQRLQDGNYPAHPHPGSEPQILVQFCHGAPGIGMLFAQCARERGRSKYLEWAEECAHFITRDGFLKKGVSLCHGSCGNAFLLLQLFQQTRKKEWLLWAQKFGLLLTLEDNQYLWRQADQPFCFANGVAGAIHFYKVLGDLSSDKDNKTLADFPLLHVRPDQSNVQRDKEKRKGIQYPLRRKVDRSTVKKIVHISNAKHQTNKSKGSKVKHQTNKSKGSKAKQQTNKSKGSKVKHQTSKGKGSKAKQPTNKSKR